MKGVRDVPLLLEILSHFLQIELLHWISLVQEDSAGAHVTSC